MEERLTNIIRQLRSIDDELNNATCLVSPEDKEGFPIAEFTFWGIANMIEDFLKYTNI